MSREARGAPPAASIGAGLDPAAAEQFSGSAFSAGGGGTLGCVQLYNPNESRTTLIVEHVQVSASSVTTVSLRRSDTPLATLSTQWRDGGRRGYGGHGQVRTEAPAAAPGIEFARTQIATSDSKGFPRLRVVLDPGEGLVVCVLDVSTVVAVTFVGREQVH